MSPRSGEIAVDATVGLAGHAVALLERLAPGGALVGLDRDPEIARQATERLAREAPPATRWVVRQGNAADLAVLLEATPAERGFDLFLMDCGVCSVHFDQADRGFSFRLEGPLSMKLDPEAPGPTAEEVIHEAEPEFLWRLLRVYGEEPQARRIVDHLVRERRTRRFRTTTELAEAIWEAYPARFRGGRRHPATRTFQALRIHVNDELGALARALRASLEGLNVGGRAAFIGFHSLEIRLIKQALRAAAEPVFATADDRLKGRGLRPLELGKRLKPSDEECDLNPRARSAVLRWCRKLAPLPTNISWPEPPLLTR